MKATRVGRAGLAILVVTGLATGCGGGDESSSDGSGTKTVTVAGIAFPAPEKTSLTIGEPSISITELPLYLAADPDIAGKFGITIEVKTFQGDAPVVQALVAGQIDMADTSAGPIATQTSNRPAPAVFVVNDKLTDILYGRPGVTSAEDLRGKAIAVSSFGSYSYAEALLALKSLGLTDKDVTLTAVGNDGARLAALKAGSVAASIQDVTIESQLTEDGNTVILRMTDVSNASYPGPALTVPTSFSSDNPNTTLVMTAMMTMAVHTIITDLDKAATVWAKYAQEPVDQAKAEIKAFIGPGWRPADGRCDKAAFDFQKSVLVATNKKLANVDTTKVCTDKFIDKLADLGFQKAIGMSGY